MQPYKAFGTAYTDFHRHVSINPVLKMRRQYYAASILCVSA